MNLNTNGDLPFNSNQERQMETNDIVSDTKLPDQATMLLTNATLSSKSGNLIETTTINSSTTVTTAPRKVVLSELDENALLMINLMAMLVPPD